MTTPTRTISRRAILRLATAALGLGLAGPVLAADPIKIGLVTALSGQSAKAGEAITRGLSIAIDEINAKGGVLGGRQLELVRRDDEANPAKGQVAARELIFKEKVAVLFGGLDTPVALAIVPIVNQEKVVFIDPWAAGTPITRNGANPNSKSRMLKRNSFWGNCTPCSIRSITAYCLWTATFGGESPIGPLGKCGACRKHSSRPIPRWPN